MSIDDVYYYTGSYPKDHWALRSYKPSDRDVLALASFRDKTHYAAYLHPKDKRGIRSIVVLTAPDMESTFNRPYNLCETLGHSTFVDMVRKAYSALFPVVQSMQYGNNSLSFDEENRRTLVGTPEEPSRLNAHIAGRGDPEKNYIGVKLGGPIPKRISFNWSADGKEPGNEIAVPWTEEEMEKASKCIKEQLECLKLDYEAFGLTITT